MYHESEKKISARLSAGAPPQSPLHATTHKSGKCFLSCVEREKRERTITNKSREKKGAIALRHSDGRGERATHRKWRKNEEEEATKATARYSWKSGYSQTKTIDGPRRETPRLYISVICLIRRVTP